MNQVLAQPNTRTISVCGFVPYPLDTTPSQRFRIEQWKPFLATEGINVDLFPFADAAMMVRLHQPKHIAGKVAAMSSALLRTAARAIKTRQYDAVFIHRAMAIAGPAALERVVRMLGVPVIFDFDDAIYMLHTSEANRRFGWLKFPGKTAAICGLSAHIVVGNQFLADYARQFNPCVTVVPTSINTDLYRPQPKANPNGKVVIGWTGSSTSQTYLEWFAPVLRQLKQTCDFELRVVSNREPDLPDLEYVWRPWSPETEIAEIGQFDIGIMPMPDDKWSLGKCALKALQCMALGQATVATDIGANREVIQHNVNGMLAGTDEDWLIQLKTLVDDPALRARLGAAGKETVDLHFSAQRCAAKFAAVVRATVS
ncbi:MAG: glycosyltransferase family 4 protein [Pyrinomonadaceae bacterium]